MFRLNVDHFYEPNDAVGGTSAPSVARRYTRGAVTGNASDTWVLSPNLLNEARIGYLNGDPVTLWEAQTLSTAYTRGGSVPFTIGQSRESNLHSRQFQFSDTLSWSRGKQTLRLGTSVARHTSGGTGSEPGTASLGTFTFLATTTAPFDQLKLSDVQNYQQPISFGISSYELSQVAHRGVRAGQHPREQRPDARRRAPVRPAVVVRREEQLRATRRLRLASEG
jgi:hypothetical protein